MSFGAIKDVISGSSKLPGAIEGNVFGTMDLGLCAKKSGLTQHRSVLSLGLIDGTTSRQGRGVPRAKKWTSVD